jgi:Recombination endonuclease VII
VKTAECHPNRKMQARGLCKPCYDKWLKAQNPGYKERQLSNTTRWINANPGKREEYQQRRKAKVESDPQEKERVFRQNRSNMLKRNYGITLEDYEAMFTSQGNCCAICRREPGNRPLHVDHCHDSGVVRGLLCHQCNWYLGTIEADRGVLERLLEYLKTNNSPVVRGHANDNDH